MASIVYRTINGTKYAYSSESYWDRDKKAPRTRRKYLGKVDPESGEIIRVYKKADQTEKADDQAAGVTDYEAISAELAETREEVQRLKEQNAAMTAKLTALKELLDSIP